MNTSPQANLDKPGFIAAGLAAVGWASTGIFVRYLPGWPPLDIVTGRFFIALIAVSLLIIVSRQKNSFKRSLLQPKSWFLSALMICYYLCATVAFQLAPVGEVALCISTSPLFVLVFQLVLKRPTAHIEKLGSLIAFIGVILVFIPSLGHNNTVFAQRTSGVLLSLVGAMIMATYALSYQTGDNTQAAPASAAVAFLTFLLGFMLLAGWLVLSGHLAELHFSFPLKPVLVLAGLGTVATIMPTICYSLASQRLSPMLTTSVRLLTPIFAALFGIVFIAEIPTTWFWLGGTLVIGGLLLMTVKRNR